MPCQQDMAVVAPCFFMGHVTSPPAYPCAIFLTKTAQDKEKNKETSASCGQFFFSTERSFSHQFKKFFVSGALHMP